MSRVGKRIALGLVAGLFAAGLVVGGLYLYRTLRPRPDIHKLGGTLLVFEVDEDAERPAAFRPEDLASALKRRLDPHDAKGITVRVLDPARIEIGIPRGEEHADYVRRVKALAAQTGELEFRILANEEDDNDAISAAEDYLRFVAEDAKLRRERDDRAVRGQPPPPPPGKEGFASGRGHVFTYTWLEVGPRELRVLNLLLDDGTDDEGVKERRASVALARDKGEAVRLASLLLYSRPCRNGKLTEAERAQKQFDWFLFTRDPERDPVTGESRAITGAFIDSVRMGEDSRGEPAVHLHFNARGSELFYELTSQNKPDREDLVKRQIAIVLDGQIMRALSLNSAIRENVEMSGGFSLRDVEDLVILLRAGSLPAKLKPAPVEERTVGPNEAPGPQNNP